MEGDVLRTSGCERFLNQRFSEGFSRTRRIKESKLSRKSANAMNWLKNTASSVLGLEVFYRQQICFTDWSKSANLDKGWHGLNDQKQNMTSRLGKTAIVFLLGIVLGWQGLFAVPAGDHSATAARSASCCRTDCADCPPKCCARPSQPTSPSTPAPARPASQNESQALALPPVARLALYAPSFTEPSFHVPGSVPVAAVPLFQRDCCYLI